MRALSLHIRMCEERDAPRASSYTCGHTTRTKNLQRHRESSDTYDTVDWLIKHVPNNNGKAGIYGISYPGFYAANGAIDAHPAMKASSPQAPVRSGSSAMISAITAHYSWLMRFASSQLSARTFVPVTSPVRRTWSRSSMGRRMVTSSTSKRDLCRISMRDSFTERSNTGTS